MSSQTLSANIGGINSVEAAQQLLVDWMRQYLGDLLDIDPEEVDLDTSFSRFGLDSSAAIGLTGDLSRWLGADVDEATPYDHPTIRELASALVLEPATLQAVCRKL